MKKREVLRFLTVAAGICIFYFILITRLFYWQVVRADSLRSLGKLQSEETLVIPAMRGEIRTSDNFPVATNTISFLVYSNPKVINDVPSYAQKLASILGDDPASISAKLIQNLFWVKLAQNLDSDKKDQIAALNLPGIGFEQEYSRMYPEASMAAHLVGFVGRDSYGAHRGYFGIEGEYNDQLAGRSGALYAVKDALGNPIINDVRKDQKIDGRNVRLTIDRTIQYIADQKLATGINKYEADGGSVIVMNPQTGAVLAMSSYPSFNAQDYYDFDPKNYANPALSDLYEPGSTFKVLIMGAAIDKNLVKPETRCDICGGPVQIGEYQIKTWDNKYFPNTSMEDVIVHSDNTGMVFVSRKLGLNTMVDYLRKYGLGVQTGIDLQGEATGVVKDPERWYPIDLATASFGQGISITPIQLITAVSSIANGGNLMQPYVVSQIQTPEGKTIDIQPKVKNKTISNVAAKIVTSMMIDAVERGEAKWTKIPNYKIAGKTGTAQIPVAGHYDANQTVASFVGFFPPDNPKVAMLVVLHRPKTSIYGSETAAPIFFNIARDIIKYYNLPPE